MEKVYKICLTVVLAMVSQSVLAQQQVEMADTMRSNGKIYVIVTIVLLILGGLITYLFLLDRKLTKLEKRFSEKR